MSILQNNMINPITITNYNQTHAQLEEVLLWWAFAAGHNAISTAEGIDYFLGSIKEEMEELYEEDTGSPFNNISIVAMEKGWDYIRDRILSGSGLGCWRIKSRTVQELVQKGLNLHTCTVEDLESVFGIGPKTARCFLMHSRKGMRIAGLDVHILRFLSDHGIEVPKSTPTGKRYKVLEQEFLRLCDEAGREPAEYDLAIWNEYRKKA
jgi:hypothetical protein